VEHAPGSWIGLAGNDSDLGPNAIEWVDDADLTTEIDYPEMGAVAIEGEVILGGHGYPTVTRTLWPGRDGICLANVFPDAPGRAPAYRVASPYQAPDEGRDQALPDICKTT
jgi:hypothetical protein